MDITVPFKIINAPQLKAELDAASGGAYQGYSIGSKWLGMARLSFADGTKQPAIDATIDAYEAHDPAVLTADQERVKAQETAIDELKAVDFSALQKTGTLQEVRDAVFKMAVAFGLADGKRG
jgi:hypothetical protein